MKIVKSISDLQAEITSMRNLGSIGFVPTMGALHPGHLSLVERSISENSFSVVSIFVNPRQFNDKNDLDKYPRCESADADLLSSIGCDMLFIPDTEEINSLFTTPRSFDFGGLDNYMEGPSRPGHFQGVADIVSLLFELIEPNRAYFGEKDFQQLAIIRHINSSLNNNIEIIGCPIMRDKNGLALSSRNLLLSESGRGAASHIYSVLLSSVAMQSSMNVSELEQWVITEIEKLSGMSVEYYTICNSVNLRPLDSWDTESGSHGCIVVRYEGVRLIDNIKYL